MYTTLLPIPQSSPLFIPPDGLPPTSDLTSSWLALGPIPKGPFLSSSRSSGNEDEDVSQANFEPSSLPSPGKRCLCVAGPYGKFFFFFFFTRIFPTLSRGKAGTRRPARTSNSLLSISFSLFPLRLSNPSPHSNLSSGDPKMGISSPRRNSSRRRPCRRLENERHPLFVSLTFPHSLPLSSRPLFSN